MWFLGCVRAVTRTRLFLGMSEAGERMGRGLGRMWGRGCGKPPPGKQTGEICSGQRTSMHPGLAAWRLGGRGGHGEPEMGQ